MKWKTLNLTWHYVEKWADKKPEAEAMVFEDERLSMARNEFLTTYMAAGKVGAVWLGLSPKFTLDELRYQVGDSKPTVLISLREYLDVDLAENITALMKEFPCIKKALVIGEAVEGTENFKEFVQKPRPKLDETLEKRASTVTEDDDALLLYTSGSTGKPKGVVHTHKSIIRNIEIEVEKFYFKETTKGLLHFPINHVAADTEIGFAAILGGGAVVFMDQFDPGEVLKVIEKERITVLGQVPVMYLLEFKQPDFFKTDFSSIEGFMWAGAAAPKIMIDVLTSICEKTGAVLITGYGSTEVAGFVTYTEKGDDLETVMKTAGKIAPPFELKIVDEGHEELPDGEIGEIAVKGPFLMKGYFNKPEATAEVIDEGGWYYTTDLAYKDERGYIYITGRKSEMFKTGGENVYPREIEETLELHDSVLFAAVMGVNDEIYQEVGWAFVMLIPGKTATEEELLSLCKSKLANFKVPKKFFIRELLPLLSTGKVDKLALKKEISGMLKN